MLYSIILIIITLVCIMLTFAVLLQSGDGNGLSGIANAGSSTQMMGSRRTADILSKATTYLGSAFLVLCVLANFAIEKETVDQSTIQQAAPNAATGQTDFSNPTQSQSAIPTQDNASQQQNAAPESGGNGDDQ